MMQYFEVKYHHPETTAIPEQSVPANTHLQKLQHKLRLHLQLLLDEMMALDKKVQANVSSDTESVQNKFTRLREQAALLAHSLELLKAA